MGIYLPNMEMPTSCGVCPCFHAESPMYCQAVKAAVQKPRIVRPYAKGRSEWCPLIEIPKHGRLIDADELIETGCRKWTSYDLERIANAPTIIPAKEGE